MSLMMSNSFNTKAFKKLKAEWYKKLKESGFDDAESKDRQNTNEQWLNQWHSKYFYGVVKKHGINWFKIKQEY